MKKGRILGVLLAAAMAFGGVTGAVGTRSVKADDSSKYKFDKQYLLKAGDSETAESPAETFSFGKNGKAELYKVQNTKFHDLNDQEISDTSDVEGKHIPQTITIGNAPFEEGQATSEGTKKKVTITSVDATSYPSAGYYFYKFQETAGDSAGVTYNTDPYYIRVAVAYNSVTKALEINNVTMFNNAGQKVQGIDNFYSAGKLTVQKIVTGNMANSDDTFDVKVTFTPKAGKKLKSKIAGRIIDNNLGNVTITDGKDEQIATFKVKAGTTVVFTNIPEGVSYKVEETKAKGYDEPAYKVNTKEGTKEVTKEGNEGTIVGGNTDEAIITNNKGTLIDTGVFMNNLPYLLVLIFAAACGVGFVVSKKRR